MYLLSSVGGRVSHSENTSPNPAGAPDAIRGKGGLAPRDPSQRKGAAQTAPSSPAPAAPLPGPTSLGGGW